MNAIFGAAAGAHGLRMRPESAALASSSRGCALPAITNCTGLRLAEAASQPAHRAAGTAGAAACRWPRAARSRSSGRSGSNACAPASTLAGSSLRPRRGGRRPPRGRSCSTSRVRSSVLVSHSSASSMRCLTASHVSGLVGPGAAIPGGGCGRAAPAPAPPSTWADGRRSSRGRSGTSSSVLTSSSGRHIFRATSPCRRRTAFELRDSTQRERRHPDGVLAVHGSEPPQPLGLHQPVEHLEDHLGVVALVPGGHRRVPVAPPEAVRASSRGPGPRRRRRPPRAPAPRARAARTRRGPR